MLQIFHQGTLPYDETLQKLSRRGDADLDRVEQDVRAIIREVAEKGDVGLRSLIEKFEQRSVNALKIDKAEQTKRSAACPEGIREKLKTAADRIRRYHTRQIDNGFRYEEDGIELGQRVRPLKSVGVYAPGGKARYPSSVLMAAIPAAVAGVKRIVLSTPNPTAEVVAAAEIAGVTEIVDAGGAQAIAALAYGTESIDAVDKIVGPGNIYVACAKRLVFGRVDIDSIAGPSEILVVADDYVRPAIVAADLLSQAEHDEDAYPLLIALSISQAKAVAAEVRAQLPRLSRREIAETSVKKNGVCFVAHDLKEAARVADTLAAEHVALCVQDPDALLADIQTGGAFFLGNFTPEAAGDYVAGPSHVLPTGGAARFNSPLGVYDFVVRSSLIRYSEKALSEQSELIRALANLEGLDAHAHAVSVRLD
jgi:histidinol dehydrogenase